MADTSTVILERMIVRERRPEAPDETAKPTIIDGDRVRRTARTTPLEALSQEAADVYVSSRGSGLHGVASGASGGIHVRGLGGSPNSQVLIVEDGVPDYQGIFGHPIPDAFAPALIERVVLVKGGDGVLYGTNAMGGVIVVENRWPSGENPRLSNDFAYGSFNTFRERVTLEMRSGPFSFVGAGSAFRTDGHRTGMGGACMTGHAGVSVDFPNSWSLSIRDKVVHLEGGDPGPVSHPYTDHHFEVTRNLGHLRLDGALGRCAFRLNTWLNVGVHQLYDGFYSRDYTGGTKLEFSRRVLNTVDLRAGVQGDYIDGLVENRIDNENEPVQPTLDAAAYGQAVIRPVDGLQMVAGGRAHYSNRYGFVPLYKAGVRWELFGAVTLHTRISRNFRQPTLRELYLPYPTANPDLRPERALNWDGGIEVRWRMFRLACTPFRTWADNLIKYFGSWPTAEVVNIDEIDIWGVDIQAGLIDMGPVAIDAAYCWQDVGRYTKQNPAAKANVTVRFEHAMGSWEMNAACGGEWVHGIYMNNYARDPLDDVLFVDVSLGASKWISAEAEIEPWLIVRNVLNRRYEYIDGYRMPGIHFLGGLRVEL
jgi:outer membrane cobalamin receptor